MMVTGVQTCALPISTHYENGFYLSATTDYPVPELVTAALSLEVGEYAKIESEYGIHFILKYPLDEKAYEKEENTDWFGDLEADAAMAQGSGQAADRH